MWATPAGERQDWPPHLNRCGSRRISAIALGILTVSKRVTHLVGSSLPKPVKRRIDTALSNSFGFGGQNAVLLFRKPE